ncbi:protein translocase subunit SecF [Rhabdaerophilum sp. SD176]|uniref:protein translocase subunit SecF n=1 Tax=Rhabdaerophilum sp. SD176 TaxID=2983548 RepID=UPI0024E035D7|nr:protein translocase subunit SecF [Rhabdaerophilum sp. SD176]
MKLLRLVPDNTRFGFMRFRRVSFPLSALLSIVSVVTFLWLGMNVGIDFKGGTVVELQARGDRANIAQVRETASGLNLGDVEVQEFGSPREVILRVGLQEGGDAAQAQVVTKLRNAFEAAYEFRRVEVVGPRVSQELVQNGTIGVLLAIMVILVYLWFRYEWQFAVGAVIATMHDLVLTIGFYAVTQIQFDQTSIAAILTIIGYSLNDTVVVYDRVRELLRKYKKIGLHELLDLSMNSTLSRTVITSITAILALIALAIFGGDTIQGFCLAMLFGIVVGTYSSIFVAAPILIYLGVRVGEGVGAAAGNADKAINSGATK